MVQIHLHSRDQASGSKGNSSCYVDPDGLARFGRGYEAPAIKLHDVIFHCHEGKATVARYENTHRDALIFDDLLYHCILRSRRKVTDRDTNGRATSHSIATIMHFPDRNERQEDL